MTWSFALLYGLWLAAATGGLALLARRPGWDRAIGLVVGLIMVGMLFAALAPLRAFGKIHLVSHVVLIQTPLLLTAISVVVWRRRKPLARAALAGALAVGAIGVDAFVIEPRWLEISHVTVQSEKIEHALDIAVIADLQTDHIGDYERQALGAVMAEKPDLILLTGDYVQTRDPQRKRVLTGQLRTLLGEIGLSAPLGVYAVQGDVDSSSWTEIFAGLPITAWPVTSSDNLGPLDITGLDLADSRNQSLSIAPNDRFHIVFGHAPDFALADVGADLLVAGHTHGGQVRLPFIGPLMTLSEVPRSWAAGVTQLSGNRTLVVSRGIGMERGQAPPIRFLCRPEIVVIHLEPMRD